MRGSAVARETAEHLRWLEKKSDAGDRERELLVELAHANRLSIQHLDDNARANEKTVLATAAALKDAEESRRQQSEQRWTPLGRISLAVGIIVAIIEAVRLFVYFSHK